MSLIDPDALPGYVGGALKIDPAELRRNAKALSGIASSISDGGSQAVTAWSALSASFHVDGAEGVEQAMAPVGVSAAAYGTALTTASGALSSLADDLEPVVDALLVLHQDATAFVTEAKNFTPRYQAPSGWDIAGMVMSPLFSAVSVIDGQQRPDGSVRIDRWDQDPDMVARNNELIRRGETLNEQWVAAQSRAATTILAAVGKKPSARPSASPTEQAIAQVDEWMHFGKQADISTPWGATGDRKESCGEKTVSFPAHLGGGILTGAWHTVTGVSSLVTGWDGNGVPWYIQAGVGAITGDHTAVDDALNAAGETYKNSWTGMAHLAGGLAESTVPGAALLTPFVLNASKYLPGKTGKDVQAWFRQDQAAVPRMVGGLVGIQLPEDPFDSKQWKGFNPAQAWVDNPGEAAGESLLNVGSLFVGGEAVAGVHGVSSAADGVRMGAEALEHARGLDTLNGLDDAAHAASAARGAGDAAHAATHLDTGLPLPDAPDSLLSERITTRDAPLTSPPHVPDELAAADTSAGSSHWDLNGHSAAGDHEIGGADGGAGDHVSSTSGGHGAANQGSEHPASSHGATTDMPKPQIAQSVAAHHDPVHNGAPSGDGWKRVADDPPTGPDPSTGKLDDTHYGQPMADHGASGPYPQESRSVQHAGIVSDPEAPYGRNAQHQPLTKDEYDERFVLKNGWDNYPPNHGAVAGTTVQYDRLPEYIRDYGNQLDRLGKPDGGYLGVRIDGHPDTFEARAVPPSSLAKPYFSYEFTGVDLPEGWHVEISEIAPAFGRDGGGLQVLVKNAEGAVVPVRDLLKGGILR